VWRIINEQNDISTFKPGITNIETDQDKHQKELRTQLKRYTHMRIDTVLVVCDTSVKLISVRELHENITSFVFIVHSPCFAIAG